MTSRSMHSRCVSLGLIASPSHDAARPNSIAPPGGSHRGASASFADFGQHGGWQGRRPSDAMSTSSGLVDRDPRGAGWAGGAPSSPSSAISSHHRAPGAVDGTWGTPGSPQRDHASAMHRVDGDISTPLLLPGRTALVPGALSPTVVVRGAQDDNRSSLGRGGLNQSHLPARTRSGLVPQDMRQ